MLKYYSAVERRPTDRIVMSWDIALSEQEAADYSACVVLLKRGDSYYVLMSSGASFRSTSWRTKLSRASVLQLYASYALVDARFLDALQVGSNSPFADANGNVQILPGNRIPAIPRNRVKAGIEYSITDALKVGGDALFVSSQYFVGDESNQAQRVPSYAVFNLHTSYQINKTFQIYARADNVFDNRYATYGTFFDTGAIPNFANGGAPFTDPRSLSPARPRAFYVGLKATF
jgi:outer membrane receptor protein involved in Fe transport